MCHLLSPRRLLASGVAAAARILLQPGVVSDAPDPGPDELEEQAAALVRDA